MIVSNLAIRFVNLLITHQKSLLLILAEKSIIADKYNFIYPIIEGVIKINNSRC